MHDLARDVLAAVRNPREWSFRWRVFAALSALYLLISLLILIPNTPVLNLDSRLMHLYLWHYHPSWHPPIAFVVAFGQRWIMTYVLQFVFIWAAFRERSIRPLVLFATAIAVLNIAVGALKYTLGRVGPMHQDNPHDVLHLGGNIFPSGHVSNTVVLYGVLAWALPRYRKWLIGFAVTLSICVGLGTVYMRTHWFSDVVGGWIIGAMVLLFVPTVLPWAQRLGDQLAAQALIALERHPRAYARARRIFHRLLERIPADPVYARPMTIRRPEPIDQHTWPVTADR